MGLRLPTRSGFENVAIGIRMKCRGWARTLDELAAACGVSPRAVRISADAMLSLGLVE
jgi:hypothetical protein